MQSTSARLTHKYDSPSGNVSYILFQPEHIFSFTEGQFCMIETTLQEKTIQKPYSIASTNLMLQQEKLIGFIVKKASDQGMSHYLTKNISLGDEVVLKGPLGHYVDSKKNNNYLFVSTGSGLSPNFGLFQHLVYEQHNDAKIVSLFGERNSHELIPFVTDCFFNHGKDSVQTTICLSQEERTTSGFTTGYVQHQLKETIAYLGKKTSCFVCGSPVIVKDVVYQLLELGIAREDITIEKY